MGHTSPLLKYFAVPGDAREIFERVCTVLNSATISVTGEQPKPVMLSVPRRRGRPRKTHYQPPPNTVPQFSLDHTAPALQASMTLQSGAMASSQPPAHTHADAHAHAHAPSPSPAHSQQSACVTQSACMTQSASATQGPSRNVPPYGFAVSSSGVTVEPASYESIFCQANTLNGPLPPPPLPLHQTTHAGPSVFASVVSVPASAPATPHAPASAPTPTHPQAPSHGGAMALANPAESPSAPSSSMHQAVFAQQQQMQAMRNLLVHQQQQIQALQQQFSEQHAVLMQVLLRLPQPIGGAASLTTPSTASLPPPLLVLPVSRAQAPQAPREAPRQPDTRRSHSSSFQPAQPLFKPAQQQMQSETPPADPPSHRFSSSLPPPPLAPVTSQAQLARQWRAHRTAQQSPRDQNDVIRSLLGPLPTTTPRPNESGPASSPFTTAPAPLALQTVLAGRTAQPAVPFSLAAAIAPAPTSLHTSLHARPASMAVDQPTSSPLVARSELHPLVQAAMVPVLCDFNGQQILVHMPIQQLSSAGGSTGGSTGQGQAALSFAPGQS
jgi:hypothetical protein